MIMLLVALPFPGAGESRLPLSGSSAPCVHCRFGLVVGDQDIADTPCVGRSFFILNPST
jgi:hypothetical protein